MDSIESRTPLYRIDKSAECPQCETGGRDVAGVKVVRKSNTDRIAFECDSCGWSSKVYEYSGENRTPATMLYADKIEVTLVQTGDVLVSGRYELQRYDAYTVVD